MKKDIILCGVGGQGILSIATIIGQAATQAGIYLKQAEVHGMSQRGGDVQSHLRLSTEPIWSDLIPMASADVIISMEPMESLRYLEYLSPEGTVVTGSVPFVNIPNYPDETALQSELDALPHVVKNDIEAVAKDCNGARGANMVLLGMAALGDVLFLAVGGQALAELPGFALLVCCAAISAGSFFRVKAAYNGMKTVPAPQGGQKQ